MKMRYRRNQFWWTWHYGEKFLFSREYGWFDWGVGRIKLQQKG